MSFKAPIDMATHPRTESHRRARQQVHELSEKATKTLARANTHTNLDNALSPIIAVNLIADVCRARALKHTDKAREILKHRDELCQGYGITLPADAPSLAALNPAAAHRAVPQTHFTIKDNVLRINPMRNPPINLPQAIMAEANEHYAQAARATRQANLAQTFFLTSLSQDLQADADYHKHNGDRTAAIARSLENESTDRESSGNR